MEVIEIYSFIAQTIADNIREDGWQKAYMLIERQEGMVKFGAGKYTDASTYLKPFTVRDRQASMQAARVLHQLHATTTAGGNNIWNFLWFNVLPNGAYEIDFIWNQDEEDKLNHLSQTESFNRSARSTDLQAFTQAQAERRSPLVYELLVREVVKLIPEAWTTAWVSLREAGIGLVEHQAAYQHSAESTEDGLNITYSWPVLLAVEELQRLKTSSGHPDWQQVTFQIAAAGTYRATFLTQSSTENTLPLGYTSEGQWLVTNAAAPLTT
jgi:hypothetical protein